MYKALDIAFWFIAKNNLDQIECGLEDIDGISNMKVQKLLYFAQGISYAFFDKKLFNEELLAWEHGPVIREVYDEFSKFHRNSIDLDEASSFNSEVIAAIETDSETREILTDVYDSLNRYTAYQLRNISHDKDGPWARVYKPGELHNVIELDDFLVNYFKTHFEQN